MEENNFVEFVFGLIVFYFLYYSYFVKYECNDFFKLFCDFIFYVVIFIFYDLFYFFCSWIEFL